MSARAPRSTLRTKGIVGLAAGIALSAACGCAHDRRPVLPTGAWTGDGHVYYENWSHAEEAGGYAPDAATFIHRGYPTELKLEHVQVGEATLTRMEIVSRSGKLDGDDDGDGTHLICYLEPVRQTDEVTTYALAGKAVSRNLEEKLDDPAPTLGQLGQEPPTATCRIYGGSPLLQIKYMEGFSDMLLFMGGACYKVGQYQPDGMDGLVHWHETLRRK